MSAFLQGSARHHPTSTWFFGFKLPPSFPVIPAVSQNRTFKLHFYKFLRRYFYEAEILCPVSRTLRDRVGSSSADSSPEFHAGTQLDSRTRGQGMLPSH